MEIIPIDLRPITYSSKTVTFVEIEIESRNSDWITCGETSMLRREDGRWPLSATIKGMTDCDHDAAIAFRMLLIGVEFDMMHSGSAIFTGWIDPNLKDGRWGDFRVPKDSSYNPAKMPGAGNCKRCKGEDKHMFVPDGFYLPPFDAELYEAVKGKRVRITTRAK